jgi:hypothetical protein
MSPRRSYAPDPTSGAKPARISSRDGTHVFERSVAADSHPQSPRCAGSLRCLPLNANVRPQRMRVREFENLTSRGGMVDSNWQGMAGSLGRSAARRLLCSSLATTAGSLERQGFLEGTPSCSSASERPSIAGATRSRSLRVAASGLDRSAQDWRG